MSLISNLSIKQRLIAIIIGVSISLLILGFSITVITDIDHLKKELVNNATLDATLIGEYCILPSTFGDRKGVIDILEKLRALPNIVRGCYFNAKGELLGEYNKIPTKLPPPPVYENRYSNFVKNFLHLSVPIFFNNEKIGTVYLIASTGALSERIQNRIFVLVLIMLGMIILSYILAARLQNMISHPILKLAKVTESISSKPDFSVRVQKERSDEIGVLYDGFNNMLEQIQIGQKRRDEAEHEQKRLLRQLEEKNKELEQVIYVTSHDLRSPLVNIQGFSQELGFSLKEIELLLNKLKNVPEGVDQKIKFIVHQDIDESLKYIEASTSKMDGLLSGLLKLSRVDRMGTVFTQIDMNRLISDILNAFEFQLKEARVKMEVGPLHPCYGNELQVNQLFSNLLSNALKYLDPNRPGEITISGGECQQEGFSMYSVKDNGIGIPKEYHNRIFEIFHRLNPSETEGEGLGLTIVGKIIGRHHGKVSVISEPGKGSEFQVLLPRASNY